MELWEVLELNQDSGFVHDDQPGNGDTIGLGTYPIFNEEHRATLNQKILERYWDREIGMETISKFRLAMKRRMNEIMPYYNQLYASELFMAHIDPLSTFGLTTTRSDTGASTMGQTTTSHATNNSTSVSRAQNSDTPQNALPDGWEENADYATSGAASQAKSDSDADTTGSNTANGTNTANGNSTTTGFQGSAADLLTKFRATIINIDLAILNDLNQLFMGVWDNGDELLPTFPYAIGYYGPRDI